MGLTSGIHRNFIIMVSNKDVADEEAMSNYDQTDTSQFEVDLCGLFRSQRDFCSGQFEEWWCVVDCELYSHTQ